MKQAIEQMLKLPLALSALIIASLLIALPTFAEGVCYEAFVYSFRDGDGDGIGQVRLGGRLAFSEKRARRHRRRRGRQADLGRISIMTTGRKEK